MLLQPLKKKRHGFCMRGRTQRLYFAGIGSQEYTVPKQVSDRTRLTCSVLSHACMQLVGDQKEACAPTSLKQIRLTCLLQRHTQMPQV